MLPTACYIESFRLVEVDGMESFGRYLAHSLLAVLGGLPLGCLAGGVGLAAYSWATESRSIEHLPEAAGLGLLTSLAAVFIGVLPAFVYGAPLYALLSRFGLVNWGTSAASRAGLDPPEP